MIQITPQMAEEMYRNSQAPAKESKYKFENGRMIERYPQQAPKQRGKGGFLSSIISELGGAGGAATGAAIGAGFGGIGAIPGAIIGGFLGGTSGKVAENKYRDNQNFFGAGGSAKSAFGEGVLSGALSGAGEVLTAAKGAKAAGVGIKEALNPETAKAVRTAGLEAPGLLSRLSGGAKQDVVNPIVKASPFAAADEKAITKTVDQYVKGFSAKGKYQNLGAAFSSLDKEIATKLDGVAGNTTADALKKTITSGLQQDLRFVPGDKTYETALKRVLSRVDSQATKGELNASDIFKVKQYLNSQIGKTFEQGTPGAIQQQVARVVRDGLDGEISRIAKDVKPLTIAQSRLYDAAPGLQKSASKAAGIPLLGVKSKTAERAIQGSKYATGTALGVAGQALDSTLGRALKAQIVPRGIISGNSMTPQQTGQTQVQQNTAPYNASTQQPGGAIMPQQVPTYTLQNAIQDAQQMLGDRQTPATYLSYAKELMAYNSPAKVDKTAGGNQDNILSALSALDSAENNLVGAGGAKGPGIGQLSTIPMIGQLVNHQGAAFHNTRIETATQLAKALTGSTRPAAQVIQQYLHSLPDVTDTPEYAAQKLAFLRNDILKRAQATGIDISAYTQQGLSTPQPSSALTQALGTINAGGYQ